MKYKLFQPLAFKKSGVSEKQEDAIYPILDDATAEDRLFVVCNGIGGIGFGNVISRTVCCGITKGILANLTYDRAFTEEQFDKVIDSTTTLLDNSNSNPEHKTGSTFAVLLFHRGGCMAAHFGNTTIYHIRPITNEILYCSDGNGTSKKINSQDVDDNKLLIPKQDNKVKAEIKHITDIQPGDYFFICTKGTFEKMSDGELIGIICNEHNTDKEKRDIIVERTKDNQNSHTAYLIKVDKVIREEFDSILSVNDGEGKPSKIVPENTINITSKNNEDHSNISNWSMNEEKKNRPYIRYALTAIAVLLFIGGILYLVLAKSNYGDQEGPTIQTSIKPAQDTVATPAPKVAQPTDTTSLPQQPTADSTQIKKAAYMKQKMAERLAAEKAALAAKQMIDENDGKATQPQHAANNAIHENANAKQAATPKTFVTPKPAATMTPPSHTETPSTKENKTESPVQ